LIIEAAFTELEQDISVGLEGLDDFQEHGCRLDGNDPQPPCGLRIVADQVRSRTVSTSPARTAVIHVVRSWRIFVFIG
jgi:hypothetical protein